MKLKFTMLFLLLCSLTMLAAQSLKLELNPAKLKAGEKGTLYATLSIPEDKLQVYDPDNRDFFYLNASHPDLVFGTAIFPKTYKKSGEELKYVGSVKISLPFSVKASPKNPSAKIKVNLGYNFCYESGACDPPEEISRDFPIEIVASAVDPALSEESDSATLVEPEAEAQKSGTIPLEESAEATATDASIPWQEVIKYLLFAFLGGIILNITPCVLPILPIRIMSIVNQAQKDRSKVLAHTLVYTLGVIVSFAVMGAFFVALKTAGQSAGWGTQNQNPYFVVSLMAVVFVFALSLLGVFEITAPGMDGANRATRKGGYSGSFFGGIFAFLMAISCTGPFLGAALPFAMKLSSSLIMIFFVMIGVGFAFPFILIGLVPKALKMIPKPGDWMVLFKELMGFVLLYLVFTMLRTLLQLTDGEYFLNIIFFMLILGFAVWLYGTFVRMEKSKATQWTFTIIALALIVFASIHYLPYEEKAIQSEVPAGSELLPAPHAPEGWYVFSPALHEKLMQEGKPVFLDIGAAWCKNCHTNEKTVLFTEEIMAEFAAKGIVLLRGDFTKKDEVLLDWMKKHERMGVPFNALYIPGAEPILFPELISKSIIRDAIAKVPNPKEEK